MSNIAKTLRKQIDQAKGPESGSVVTFVSVVRDASGEPTGREYQYGAIFIAATGHWYLTSERGFFGANSFSHEAFVRGGARTPERGARPGRGRVRRSLTNLA